jgi:hypothetical protein
MPVFTARRLDKRAGFPQNKGWLDSQSGEIAGIVQD